tara:strand:+ start:123 stop:581 length:459 start_codon:yes stop_codon:yes gene_type:complete
MEEGQATETGRADAAPGEGHGDEQTEPTEPTEPTPCARAFYVYMLCDTTSRRTYIGATVDLNKRLRQHNSELAGGARRTRGRGPWVLGAYVTGFDQWTHALKFEHAWRRHGKQVKRWDRDGRMAALRRLMSKARWSSRSPLASEVDLTVTEL